MFPGTKIMDIIISALMQLRTSFSLKISDISSYFTDRSLSNIVVE